MLNGGRTSRRIYNASPNVHTNGTGRSAFIALILLTALPCFATSRSPVSKPERQQTEVIFFSSRDPDLPDVGALIEETETQILEGRRTPIHFILEYVDPAFLNPTTSQSKRAVSSLKDKHRGHKFDLVIALDEQLLTFLQQSRTQLFNDTPLLFSIAHPKTSLGEFKRPPNTTGVVRVLNYIPTLQLALRQNPGTRHVVVIAGSSHIEKLELKEAHDEFRSYETSVEFHYWTDLTFPELKTRIGTVGPDTVILFLDFIADAAGEQFIPSRVLPTLSASANRPIYGAFSSFVGNGVVGGSVIDLHEVGKIVGQYSLRILNGEKPENIPITSGEFQHAMFDWREVNRWSIARDQLPPTATVLYWESSPWETYRWKILGMAAALVVETLLITLLLHIQNSRRRAEEELRRKKEELSQAHRVAKLSSWQWDAKTDAITWSEALYNLTGFDPGTPPVPLKTLSNFFTSESWGQLNEALHNTLRTGTPYELELEAYRKDGTMVSILALGDAVRKRDGSVTGIRGTMQDTTERKRAQDALRQSEEKFSKAFRQSPMAISLTNARTHRFLDVNETYLHLTGYSREELIGRSVLDVGIWVKSADRINVVQKLTTHGSIRSVQLDYRKKDGTIGVAEGSAELIYVGGEPCVLAVTMDISARRDAEQALQESEKRFRLMVDSAPVLMWLSGPNKLYTDVNKAWLDFTGRTLHDELGEGWTAGVYPEDARAYLDVFTRAFDARKSFECEFRLRRHDGEYRWVLNRGVPRFQEDGSFAGYVGCCIDITDEKEAKLARMEFGARLLRAQEQERARIARELHDDINQRLALLSNGLQMLVQTTPEPQEAWRRQVHQLFQQTKEISEDIQGLSHELHPSKLEYLGLASATRALCHEFSTQHDFKLDCIIGDLPHHIDHHLALGLFRVLQESLHNIAKHSLAQHVKVELSCHDSSVQLRVSDDGIGFDPDEARNNSGLGLASMRERLRLLCGELSIWSRSSLGTQVLAIAPLEAARRNIA